MLPGVTIAISSVLSLFSANLTCSQLNTPDSMILGRLYVEIGVAPVRPAEFVIFRFSQWTGQDEG